MANRCKAVKEVLGYQLNRELAKRFFTDVYAYILYNDTESFLEILDYRMHIQETYSSSEDYHVFSFMLHKMQEKHPAKLNALKPLPGGMAA